MILAGDIGGTHTRLALFEQKNQISEKVFASREYPGLLPLLQEYLHENTKIERACFGVAGPVREGVCRATNLPWVIDSKLLRSAMNIKGEVFLLNDLEASAYGVLQLGEDDLFPLNQPDIFQPGNAVLVSAGTGLGEAGMYWNGREHLPFASEGGHADFAPRSPLESELLFFLQQKFGHVSYERVVSGPGLLHLYEFFIQKGEVESEQVRKEMALAKDPSFVISEWGKTHQDPLCAKTLRWFISLYGAEAGNCALNMLAFGGVYLGGGIAPRLRDLFKEGGFLESFCKKGRFDELLESMPVYIVLNPNTALLGAATFAETRGKI